MDIALPWYEDAMTDDDRREKDSDVKSLLDSFLADQRRIEAQRAKALEARDKEAFKHSKKGLEEMADRLLTAFNDHEKKDEGRHQETLAANLKLDQKIETVAARVEVLETTQALAQRPKWKESDSGLHMIADIQSAAADEAAWQILQKRQSELIKAQSEHQEVATWRGVKSWMSQILVGVLILVIGALVWTNLRLAAPGEAQKHEVAK